MYTCHVCGAVSPPAQPLLRHVVHYEEGKLAGNILREIPVCKGCLADLKAGASLDELVRLHRPRPVATPSVVPSYASFLPTPVGKGAASSVPGGK